MIRTAYQPPPDKAPQTVTFAAQCQAFQEAVQALITAAPQQALAVAGDYVRFTAPGGGLAQARSLLLLGQVQLDTHHLPAALESVLQAASLFREASDPLGAAQALSLAGQVCLALGRWRRPRRTWTRL